MPATRCMAVPSAKRCSNRCIAPRPGCCASTDRGRSRALLCIDIEGRDAVARAAHHGRLGVLGDDSTGWMRLSASPALLSATLKGGQSSPGQSRREIRGDADIRQPYRELFMGWRTAGPRRIAVSMDRWLSSRPLWQFGPARRWPSAGRARRRPRKHRPVSA